MHTRSPVEAERANRIRLSVAAYAYEFNNDSIMSDAAFDELSKAIDPTMSTDHPIMDEFFRTKFGPFTGMWIHDHPQVEGIQRIYNRHFRNR